jgi:hypothetical protein
MRSANNCAPWHDHDTNNAEGKGRGYLLVTMNSVTTLMTPRNTEGKGRGYLLVNKNSDALIVKLTGVGTGTASCVEVDVDVDEPGFEPQIVKRVVDGKLDMGG